MKYLWRFLFVALFASLLLWGVWNWIVDRITQGLSDALDYAGDRCV